jgi:hypothetical protein
MSYLLQFYYFLRMTYCLQKTIEVWLIADSAMGHYESTRVPLTGRVTQTKAFGFGCANKFEH